MDAIRSPDELPPDFGKIDGEDQPDTIIATVNWNAAVDACAKAVHSFPIKGFGQRISHFIATRDREIEAAIRTLKR